MRFRAKVDNNHRPIVEALRKAGCLVLSLAGLGKGVPDLLVYRAGRFFLLEVKNSEWRGELTDDQQKFIEKGWPVDVVYDVYEALFAVGLRRG